MKILEFRILVPMVPEKYKIGSRYVINNYVKDTQTNGEGIEIVKCEPYQKDNESGIYTYKIFHMKSKVPQFIRWAIPDKYLHIHEESYNGFPHLYTTEFVPGCGDSLILSIETQHFEYKKGTEIPDNSVNLSDEELKQREIIYIDVLNGESSFSNIPEEKIEGFVFPEAGIDKPLSSPPGYDKTQLPKWIDNYDGPLMCCVKVVRFEFKWFGLQTAVEAYVSDIFYPKLFTETHRRIVGTMKSWYNLTWEDVRNEEDRLESEQKEKENLFLKDE